MEFFNNAMIRKILYVCDDLVIEMKINNNNVMLLYIYIYIYIYIYKRS
jgi:hypothetical protein